MRIETERLFILNVTQKDASDILKIQETDYAKRYNLFPSLKIDDVHEEISDSEMYKLVLKDSDEIIGLIRVKEDYYRYNPKARHVLIIMKEEHSSKGYMSEALSNVYDELFKKYDILTGYIFADNKASIRVSEKTGWKNEGTLRQAILDSNNIVHDLVVVSLTKEDYLNNK